MKIEQEIDENYEGSYSKMQEEIKQKILEETMQRMTEEMNGKFECESEKLRIQADREVEGEYLMLFCVNIYFLEKYENR